MDGVPDRSGCADREQRSRRPHPALKPKARRPVEDGGAFFLAIRDWGLRFANARSLPQPAGTVRTEAEVLTRTGREGGGAMSLDAL